MEMNLVQKHGFVVHSREKGKWVIFEKKNFTEKQIKVVGEVTPLMQGNLIKRISKIVDWYANPQQHVPSIRMRLTGLAAGLDSKERTFVHEWMEKNYPEKVA